MSSSDQDVVIDELSGSQNSEMDDLRALLLGRDYQLVRDVLKEEGRDLVSGFLTEALHDRQESDGSVSDVLTPLVEKSVETAVVARKKQFISYLYPLVGGLVRKAVTSSLAGILEKTNELLESSFTLKGLRWRFEAYRAGVSYSQYVVQQTFEYRVEQVLLIHRDAGLLLRTVVHDATQAADGDMFSGMLTAINDFVSDSFSKEEGEQNLGEIKTDDFTLILKQGPKAILVAAITGNPPANISDKLQITLEAIHQIYHNELNEFEGDASVFENADQQLNSCLMSQQKIKTTVKKKPWFAIIVVALSFCFVCYFLGKIWYLDYVARQIEKSPSAPGIVLLSVDRCSDSLCLDVLRDPIAEEVSAWIFDKVPSTINVNIYERPYRSLDETLLPSRLENIASYFPSLSYNPQLSKFSGSLSRSEYDKINIGLNSLPESNLIVDVLDGVNITGMAIDDALLKNFVFESSISEIKKTQIKFEVDSSFLSENSKEMIKILSKKLIEANSMSKELGQSFVVLIMALSTNSGTVSYNQELNFQRANAVESELTKNGVESVYTRIFDVGSLSNDAPKVVFDILTLPTKNINSAK